MEIVRWAGGAAEIREEGLCYVEGAEDVGFEYGQVLFWALNDVSRHRSFDERDTRTEIVEDMADWIGYAVDSTTTLGVTHLVSSTAPTSIYPAAFTK